MYRDKGGEGGREGGGEQMGNNEGIMNIIRRAYIH